MKRINLVLSVLAIVVGFSVTIIVPRILADNKKVPTEIGLQIKNLQLDQARLQAEISQLQLQWLQTPAGQRFMADQQSIQHDIGELETLKRQALSESKLDPNEYDVDAEKLEFVAKPKPPAEKK